MTRLATLLLCACGGGATHLPDAAASSTLTITTYRDSGPVNIGFLAIQDGDDPWTLLAGNEGVYTATLHGARYGIATACPKSVDFYYGVASEGTALYIRDCADPGAPAATIHGTITGANAANTVRVADLELASVEVPAGSTTYSLATVAGTDKVVAEELVAGRPVKVAMAETNNADGATLDFDLASGFVPVTRALSASEPLGAASLSYADARGIVRLDRGATPFTTFRGIPGAQLGNGLNRLLAAPQTNATGNGVRETIRYFKEPVDLAVTFLPQLQVSQQPALTTTPYPGASVVFPIAATTDAYGLSLQTANATLTDLRLWTVEITNGWVADKAPGAAELAYAVPDVHGLAGWSAAFQLEPGQAIMWSVAVSHNTNYDLPITVPPAGWFLHDGSEEQFATMDGTFPAP